jgi:hypothetical protein
VVATVLTTIVLVFLLCHILKFFLNFVELWAVIKGTAQQDFKGEGDSLSRVDVYFLENVSLGSVKVVGSCS